MGIFLPNRTAWGHYRRYPRMQHGWRDEFRIFACDNIVSYLIPAKFHTGPTLLLHSCTLSSSVEPARKFVICEYHHASCPCVNIVYLQSRGFALGCLPEFAMSTRKFFTEIIKNVDIKFSFLKLSKAKPNLTCTQEKNNQTKHFNKKLR